MVKRNAKFRLGRLIITRTALDALQQAQQDSAIFLRRHESGDWGEICKEDAEANDEAISHEGDLDKQHRVISVYRTAKGEIIWIITEWDRSVTTILLPSDY